MRKGPTEYGQPFSRAGGLCYDSVLKKREGAPDRAGAPFLRIA